MSRSWRLVALVVFGWYVALAVLHFGNLRPLWNDEQCVFRSIESFVSASDYFSRPLSSLQVFPHLYLWVIGKFSSLFHYSLSSLRFLPFLAMLGALYVWACLARRVLSSERLVALFLLSWVASTPLVYYASELKQYSLDVFLTGLWLLFIFAQSRLARELKPIVYLMLLFLLPFLGLLSYPVFMFMIFPFWFLIGHRKGGWSPLIVYFTGCVLAAGLSFCIDLRLRDEAVVSAHNDLFISYASPVDFLRTFLDGVNNLIGRWFASKPYWVRIPTRIFLLFGVVEIVIGVREFFRNKKSPELTMPVITAVVFAELVVLGSLRVYPFIVLRTVLFFCPMILGMTLLSFKRIEARSSRAGIILQVFYAILLLTFALAVTRMALFGTVDQDMTRWLPWIGR